MKLEASNRRQYEISSMTTDTAECLEIAGFIDKLKVPNISTNIAEVSGMPLIYETNGKSDVDSSEYETGCCFVIGGNTLGRGVTFPSLQTIYYTRTSKKPQADTMWQVSVLFENY